MTWLKQKIKGQITISTLTGIFILIGIVGAPFLYIENIKAEGAKSDNEMAKDIAIDKTNIANLSKQLDNMNSKMDALLMKQGINPKLYSN